MDNALFTNIVPLGVPEEKTIKYSVKKNMASADEVKIAVGYFSTLGLNKLNEWVHKYSVRKITLIGGMYSVDGIPESVYIEMMHIAKIWEKEEIGQILLVNNMNYHGKIYTFWHDNKIERTILGSANLGAIAPASDAQRQYELATIINAPTENQLYAEHLEELVKSTTLATDVATRFKIVHEKNTLLDGIKEVETLTDSTVDHIKDSVEDVVLKIPIKAPHYINRLNESGSYLHSNINVCYGKGRFNKKKNKIEPRDWFEVQITCDAGLVNKEYYPKKDPFFIITDDNYMFKAHTTSANHKQLSGYGTDRILGRWIKGRLVATGLLKSCEHVEHDKNRDSMVTIEMLNRANMRVLELHKTNLKWLGKINVHGKSAKANIPKYKALDVWYATFSNNSNDLENY